MNPLLKQDRFFKAFAIVLFLALGGLGGECSGLKNEHDVTVDSTRCTAKVAQISVMDGFIQNLCGCQESTGQLVKNLTCTIPTGTTVFVHFNTATQRHQIVAVGTPAIRDSHLYEPGGNPVIPSYGFTLSGTPGDIYQFKDQFDPQLTGRFVLVP